MSQSFPHSTARDQHIEFRDPADDVMGSPIDVGFEALLDVSDEDAGLLLV